MDYFWYPEINLYKKQTTVLKKFINKKDPQIKAEFHEKYKRCRNFFSTLMKESKLRNTWKGIKIIISIKNITTTTVRRQNQKSKIRLNIIQTTYLIQTQIRSS